MDRLRRSRRIWAVDAGIGGDLATFIRNLDRLHVGVRDALPGVRTPRFRLVEETDESLLVAYSSSRPGLDPYVRGLLQGLLRRFHVCGAVEPSLAPDNGETHYRIRLGMRPS